MEDAREPAPPDHGEPLAFRFTGPQRRRYRRGLLGMAAMVWSVGLVRFTLVGRLTSGRGWLELGVLAVVLVGVARAVATIEPVTVADRSGVAWAWGPRRGQVPWEAVAAVTVVERGTARRVVLEPAAAAARRHRLPVPLTGGSLLGPGCDQDLDGKVELLRRGWRASQPA